MSIVQRKRVPGVRPAGNLATDDLPEGVCGIEDLAGDAFCGACTARELAAWGFEWWGAGAVRVVRPSLRNDLERRGPIPGKGKAGNE